jgi:hypothetical protein
MSLRAVAKSGVTVCTSSRSGYLSSSLNALLTARLPVVTPQGTFRGRLLKESSDRLRGDRRAKG